MNFPGKSTRKPLVILALAAACTAGGFAGFDILQNSRLANAQERQERIEATREQLSNVNDLATVFKSVNTVLEPSVVSIEVKKTIHGVNATAIPPEFRRFFDRDGDGTPDVPGMGEDDTMIQRGTGSGVIVEVNGSDAYIVTNNHVAGGAQDMTITLSDGRTIQNGKLLGVDPKSDLAVVKIKADNLTAAKWGDSGKLAKGDWVLAFGSPLGYVGSMTHGIVSALERQSNPEGGVGVLGPGGYENFIQVDAPINPGNSGGPLVNLHGEVIGINTAIASRTGGFQGIGFAIPSNQAKPIYEALKTSGKVTRGWLGIEIIDVSRVPEEAKAAGYEGDDGILVKRAIRGTPAFEKMQPGDVITKIDGKEVRSTHDLRNKIAVTAPGTEVKFGVSRGGKMVEVPVTIGSQPDDVTLSRGSGPDQNPGQTDVSSLGLKLADATSTLKERFNLKDVGDGALVMAVAANSPAARVGLRPGDLITRVNNTDVNSAEAAQNALAKADASNGISLYVTNRDGSQFVFVPAEILKGQ
jgi:serine protease Do